MMGDPRIENYLSTLDRSLSSLPVSDRADIVTEIKSHVFSAMERDPSQSVDSVLAALGEAETVANRYLMERGLKPAKPPISPIVKWIVIGFLGTLAIFMAGLVALVFFLSPIIKVDGEKNEVRFLGGLVQMDGDDIRIGKQGLHGMGERRFYGRSQKPGQGKTTAITLTNGLIELSNSPDGYLAWDCRGTNEKDSTMLNPGPDGELLDLTPHGFVKCDIKVPEGAKINISGANGKVELNRPRFHASVEIANGTVDIDAAENVRYGYDLSVTNGQVEEFVADPKPEYLIRVHLMNGRIGN